MDHDDEAVPDPQGADLLGPELVNRYAVPLTVLVGGAYVAVTEQVVEQPVGGAVPQWDAGGVLLGGGDGAGADSD